MRTKIILIAAIVVVIIIAISLSVYFSIHIDVNAKLDKFFNTVGQLKYYDNSTGKEMVIEQSVVSTFIKTEFQNVTFKNAIKMSNKKGGGILLTKNNETIIFDGEFVKVENNWYKTDKDISVALLRLLKETIK